MKIVKATTEKYQTNSFLLVEEHLREAVWVDPGEELPSMEKVIEQSGLTVMLILLTHGHHDHIRKADYYRKKYKAPIGCFSGEVALLADPNLNCSARTMEGPVTLEPDDVYEDGEIIDQFGIEVLHTPGHTSGSCCYRIGKTIFVGDTIFQGSVGRWDLPTGNYTQLIESVDSILTLPEKHFLLPGHGNLTNTVAEADNNPFSPLRRDQ